MSVYTSLSRAIVALQLSTSRGALTCLLCDIYVLSTLLSLSLSLSLSLYLSVVVYPRSSVACMLLMNELELQTFIVIHDCHAYGLQIRILTQSVSSVGPTELTRC